MAKYLSNRERVKKYIDNAISALTARNMTSGVKTEVGFSYYNFVNSMVVDLGISQSMVEDVLQSYIKTGKLIEIRDLKLPENEELKQEIDKDLTDLDKQVIKDGN